VCERRRKTPDVHAEAALVAMRKRCGRRSRLDHRVGILLILSRVPRHHYAFGILRRCFRFSVHAFDPVSLSIFDCFTVHEKLGRSTPTLLGLGSVDEHPSLRLHGCVFAQHVGLRSRFLSKSLLGALCMLRAAPRLQLLLALMLDPVTFRRFGGPCNALYAT
jgi:hypothetical protein